MRTMKTFKRQFIEKWTNEYDNAEKELLEAIEKDDGWISVDDKLPTPCIPVMCFWSDNGFNDEGDMTIEDLTDKDGNVLPRCINVTHWRELPATPKS